MIQTLWEKIKGRVLPTVVFIMAIALIAGAIFQASQQASNKKAQLLACERGNKVRAWQLTWADTILDSQKQVYQAPTKIKFAIETVEKVHIIDCKTNKRISPSQEKKYIDQQFKLIPGGYNGTKRLG